ncbi:unnamed protein product [Ceutorhynchus assimilis]|uniref:Sensory neuron membrane protein 2 n=1 Tax=Ceutorhynchus assimilis TaxID=467358 RepID=A0A9N9MFU8_9CUCU|nr:unnamed protein product [Ceutorhynchus assimilis]
MRLPCCSARMVIILAVLATLTFAGALLLCFWGIPLVIREQIHQQTRLSEGTEQWDRFLELPFALNYSVRFFLVQNPSEVVHNGSVPDLKESEPYTYSMKLKKLDHRFDDNDEDSVTYHREFDFAFDYSGNTHPETMVTIINPLLMAALQLANSLERLAFAGCIDQLLGSARLDKPITTQSVKKLLFDGVNFGFTNETGAACTAVRNRIIPLLKDVRVVEEVEEETTGTRYFRIAFFNYKTINYLKTPPDGIYTVNRGQRNMSALGKIMRWNGGTTIPTYGTASSTNNETCHNLRGTDSTIYPPFLRKDEPIVIYNTDICRTVELFQTNSNLEYRGISGAHKYETNENLLRPATVTPEQDCYCSKATKNVEAKDDCYLDGTFDYKPCLGAPVILSQPHFLNADPKYGKNFTTLKPDKSKHAMYLIVEPNTGTPLEGLKRVQINTVLRQEPLISFITPPTMYQGIIPVLWLEESFSIPDKYLDLLDNQYFKKVKLATTFKYGFVGVAAAIFTGCLFLFVRKQFFKKKSN